MHVCMSTLSLLHIPTYVPSPLCLPGMATLWPNHLLYVHCMSIQLLMYSSLWLTAISRHDLRKHSSLNTHVVPYAYLRLLPSCYSYLVYLCTYMCIYLRRYRIYTQSATMATCSLFCLTSLQYTRTQSIMTTIFYTYVITTACLQPAMLSYSIYLVSTCPSTLQFLYSLLRVLQPSMSTCCSKFQQHAEENLTPVSVWLKWRMPRLHVAWGLSHRWAGIFFCVQVIYVIMKIVTPCFNRPSLLSRSLVGQCTGWIMLDQYSLIEHIA